MVMGRPKKKQLDRRTVVANVRFTVREKKELVAAAKASGQKFAAWVRNVLLDFARGRDV